MKKTVFENHRIEVYPLRPHYKASHEAMLRRSAEIEASIKRHVDGFHATSVEFDKRDICSLCGDDWDTYDQGYPACCADAALEWEREHPRCKGCPDEFFDSCKNIGDCKRPVQPETATSEGE